VSSQPEEIQPNQIWRLLMKRITERQRRLLLERANLRTLGDFSRQPSAIEAGNPSVTTTGRNSNRSPLMNLMPKALTAASRKFAAAAGQPLKRSPI